MPDDPHAQSVARIAWLRTLPREQIDRAQFPTCRCRTYFLGLGEDVWRCLTCDSPPNETEAHAVNATPSNG